MGMSTYVRQPKHIRFNEIWIVSKHTFQDLEYNYYLAVRGLNGKTYRGPGFNNIDHLDVALVRASQRQRVSAKTYKESDKYGIDLLDEVTVN